MRMQVRLCLAGPNQPNNAQCEQAKSVVSVLNFKTTVLCITAGFTPLILAATAGHSDVVEILLDHGADIEAQSERTKDTPLSLACSGGRYEVSIAFPQISLTYAWSPQVSHVFPSKYPCVNMSSDCSLTLGESTVKKCAHGFQCKDHACVLKKKRLLLVPNWKNCCFHKRGCAVRIERGCVQNVFQQFVRVAKILNNVKVHLFRPSTAVSRDGLVESCTWWCCRGGPPASPCGGGGSGA